MKEAIKVQSVTIIIINGISESFQSVRWAMQKTEAIPAAGGGGGGQGSSFLLGSNMAGAVCGPLGSGERSCSRGRVRRNGPGQGALVGPSPRLGDAGRSAKVSALQGQVEVNSPPELILDIKAKCIPDCSVGFSCWGIYSRACRRLLPTRHATNNG